MEVEIKTDLYRYTGSSSTKMFFLNIIKNEGFRYTYILRKCQFYKGKKMRKFQYIFWKILLRKYRYKYGYEISDSVKIGEGFYINHLGGIAINPKAKLGNNINITKGVTIGQTNRGHKKGVPVIGNRVWIGANSTVAGNVKIGDNVLIAPNTYVNFDVPNDSVVIGNPAKIIENKKATDGYINNLI